MRSSSEPISIQRYTRAHPLYHHHIGPGKNHHKGGHVTPCFSVIGQNYGQTSHFQVSDSFNLIILTNHRSAWSPMRFQSSGSAPSENNNAYQIKFVVCIYYPTKKRNSIGITLTTHCAHEDQYKFYLNTI